MKLSIEALPPPGLELGGEPRGVGPPVGRSDVVRPRGEATKVGPKRIGLGKGLELSLPLAFGLDPRGGESEKGDGFVAGGEQQGGGEQGKQRTSEPLHWSLDQE